MPTAQEIYQQLHAAKQAGNVMGGPVFPMMGVIPSIIAGVQGLFGDDPKRYVDGREVMASQIPWGKPGRIPQERLDQWINERNKLFHATLPEHAENILKSGTIRPTKYYGPKDTDLTPLPTSGVSMSRVPKTKADAYGSAPITFELDPTKVPPNRPFAEPGWEKYKVHKGWYKNAPTTTNMNPRFEFENRTYSQPIPSSAITRIMVDKSVLPDTTHWAPFSEGPSTAEQHLINKAREVGIPIQTFQDARAMHSYRARIGEDIKRKLLEKAIGTGQ